MPSEPLDLEPEHQAQVELDAITVEGGWRAGCKEANVVLRLERADLNNPDDRLAGEADVHILRHRQGPTARLTVAFQGHHRRFVDIQAQSR